MDYAPEPLNSYLPADPYPPLDHAPLENFEKFDKFQDFDNSENFEKLDSFDDPESFEKFDKFDKFDKFEMATEQLPHDYPPLDTYQPTDWQYESAPLEEYHEDYEEEQNNVVIEDDESTTYMWAHIIWNSITN